LKQIMNFFSLSRQSLIKSKIYFKKIESC
jgi:hypothetical protein